MATKPSQHSSFSASTHDALHDQLAPYHERLHRIEQEEQKCKLQRAVIKATLAAEIGQRAGELKVSNEAVSHLLNLCW